MLINVKYLQNLVWRASTKTAHTMKSHRIRECILLGVNMFSFVSGAFLVGISMYVNQNLEHLIENRLDSVVKGSNLTRTLLARYGAIVPNKDYIPEHIDLGPWFAWLMSRMFDMGVAIMAFSVFGMYVVTSGKPLRLYVLIAILLAAVVGQLVFMVNAMDYRSQLHYYLRHRLYADLQKRYEFGAETHDPFSFIMNGVMLMGECCGINGPQDFIPTKHNFLHTGGNHVSHNATLQYPLACCQRRYIEGGFYTTLDCALSWSKHAINKRGCYKTMFTFLSDNFGTAIIWIYTIITYVELLQVLLCLSLARQLWREKRNNHSKRGANGARVIMTVQPDAERAE